MTEKSSWSGVEVEGVEDGANGVDGVEEEAAAAEGTV